MLMKSFSFRAFAIVPTLFIATGDLQKDTTSLTKNVSSSATVQSVQVPKPHLISQTIPTTYYVSGSGSDSNTGLSSSSAFRTIQRAADLTKPGDTVLIMNGLYTNPHIGHVLLINRSGTANAWINFQAYPGHKPKIKHNSWNAILITQGASYIQVKGLEVEGNNTNVTLDYAKNQQYNGNNPLTSGNCIKIDGRKTTPPHHIRILNNKIYNCGGGGIGAIQADYVTIDRNEVFNNGWYSPYANSGIILYQSWNYDTSTGYRMFITNNKVYNNRQYIPWNANGKIQDGNGIIIDDSRNTQNGSKLGAYRGRTLIANNISYLNGGGGILTYRSDHVDIINNTIYWNNVSPEINKGQLSADESSDVKIFNNIVYAYLNKRVNNRWQSTNVNFNYNIYFNSSLINTMGSNDIIADPQFVNPSIGDFRLTVTSPAINRAMNFMNTDFLGNRRPSGIAPDIGAYEHQF